MGSKQSSAIYTEYQRIGKTRHYLACDGTNTEGLSKAERIMVLMDIIEEQGTEIRRLQRLCDSQTPK